MKFKFPNDFFTPHISKYKTVEVFLHILLISLGVFHKLCLTSDFFSLLFLGQKREGAVHAG